MFNYLIIPKYIVMGIAANNKQTTIEKMVPTILMSGVYFLWFRPSV